MSEKRFKLIAARTVYHRKLNNMSQLGLATAAGISEDYVSLIENAKAPGLTLATAEKLAEALGITLETLIEIE